ncbi:unnamed protein product [Cylindrotheca closterium]|uniref:DUF6824 domain-containing protein n=1 Tax=Cylindrotheca closterium TaxID=2856 RepID=A0AAD2CQY9_9STRA|nr:unnamed protein product [Cylindrotheca closterium]
MKQKTKAETGTSLGESENHEGMVGLKTLPLVDSKPTSEVFVGRNASDVLCGRGVQVLHHAGNLNLHLAVNEFRAEYLRSRRGRKKEIIETIVKRLKSTGSRFLKTAHSDKTKWVEADETFAYQKVSHVLRGANTGKAVEKIKKQESEITKNQKEHRQQPKQAIASLSTNMSQLSQFASATIMPTSQHRLPLDFSLVQTLLERQLLAEMTGNIAPQPNMANLLRHPNPMVFLPQGRNDNEQLMNIAQPQHPSATQQLMPLQFNATFYHDQFSSLRAQQLSQGVSCHFSAPNQREQDHDLREVAAQKNEVEDGSRYRN